MRSRQAGFSLVELLITVIALGIVSIALSQVISSTSTAQRQMYVERAKLTNHRIADALLQMAESGSVLGTLPVPYTGAGRISTVYNPTDTSTDGQRLAMLLRSTGLQVNEINDDGTAATNARVYQRVTGLTQSIPLSFQAGPQVTLTYQFGVVYMTSCRIADATCHPTAASGLPGASPRMTAANAASWTVTTPDVAPVFVSTLPTQKRMLATTSERLERVRDALVSYFRARQLSAAAGDPTNFYPSSAVSLGGQQPNANQGCRDGWYNLFTDVAILGEVGLGAAEFGRTAWGGVIEYCRDFDPLGTGAPNSTPHFGAIRIHASVSEGLDPSSNEADNLILSF